ncbi:efflux RND transporter periplasmic adaptor subunit [Alicyclobacillus sp.]|uniref:efflux RND transporter periplasmic adaptor subunit n=1 Tax=Alicyclobacillus sp. TaxID=61169 RepID=UPI0025BFABD0|nr:efflux RND transporter periplasmic adaptor subunit [Alicyclobacillus sp.]MCL6515945.1 efflux RND transporter periplasmic adaptor subunit [Alicyclobacillus sp.]
MRARQILIINVIALIVVAAALIGGYLYFYNQNNYIREEDAYVAADTQYVVGTAAGKLTRWTVTEGATVHQGDTLGQETLPTGQTVSITAPMDGVVLKNSAIEGEVIAPGTVLAAIGDLAHEYVIANIKETDVRNVKVGQTVDIYIDAYPGDTFSGTVQSIGAQSAAQQTPLPSPASTTFTKEVQRVPVKISLSGQQGKDIVPRMNATVRIHRNSGT